MFRADHVSAELDPFSWCACGIGWKVKLGSSQEQVPALKSLKVWKARKKSNVILNKTNNMYFYRANQIWFRLFVLERERSLATFFGILFFGFATGTGLEVLVLRSRTLSQWPHDCGYSWADVDPIKGKGRAGVIKSMITWKTAEEKERSSVFQCYKILWHSLFFPSLWGSVLTGLLTTSKQFQPGSFCSSFKFASAEDEWAEVKSKSGENLKNKILHGGV